MFGGFFLWIGKGWWSTKCKYHPDVARAIITGYAYPGGALEYVIPIDNKTNLNSKAWKSFLQIVFTKFGKTRYM